MAFGYKVPNFNLWARIWYVHNGGPDRSFRWYEGPFYTRCQMTVPQNHIAYSKISVPKYTYVREAINVPYGYGDTIQVAGFAAQSFRIVYVQDVGAGFFNEYRVLTCLPTLDQDIEGEDQLYLGSANLELEPPDGYAPCVLVNPVNYWEDPLEVSNHPPPP